MKRFMCCIKGSPSAQQPPHYDEDEPVSVPDVNLPGGSSHRGSIHVRVPTTADIPEGSSSQLVHFQWEDIVVGTESFLESNLLGHGSYGRVYRCNLQRLDTVAAVKVETMGNQLQREFEAEIRALCYADHPNVIKLLGDVSGVEHRALVYELVSNRSLDRHLYAPVNFGPSQPSGSRTVHRAIPRLDWETRMNIALGVADALIYVHQKLRMVHRDVKITNVLLDDNFVPKLTDFGLASRVVVDCAGVEVPRIVKPVKGTPGFAAPETEADGTVSTKSDVYSFGVFLLALFTGKKAYDAERPPPTRSLADWIWPIWRREDLTTLIIDYSLGQRYSVDGFNTLFAVSRMCIDSRVISRPDMELVRKLIQNAAAYPIDN